MDQLQEYLRLSDRQDRVSAFNDDHEVLLGIYQLICQKDQAIQGLENQLTKQKAANLKQTQQIKMLQDKITQLSPNNNNTGSGFMMASQFKDNFGEFMKNNLSMALSPLLDSPQAYMQYSNELLQTVYTDMENILNQKLIRICEILNIDPQQQNNSNKIKQSLLRIFQDNCSLTFNSVNNDQTKQKLIKLNYENEEIIQIQESQQYTEMQEYLRKLCGYMLLQDRPWKFILNQKMEKKQNIVHKFMKKDYVCIDGWIREGEEVYMILEGICRDSSQTSNNEEVRHPNLKNFVIPYRKDDINEEFILKKKQISEQKILKESIVALTHKQEKQNISKNEKQNISKNEKQNISKNIPNQIYHQQHLLLEVNQTRLKISQDSRKDNVQYIEEQQQQQQSIKIQKNISKKSIKICDPLQSFSQFPTNIQQISQTCSPAPLRPLYIDNKKISSFTKHNERKQNKSKQKSHKNGNISNNNRNNNNNNSKSRHGLITDPSFDEIITLPKNRTTGTTNNSKKIKRKQIDQLPFKRETNTSRAKKQNNNSRKGSVGKIVGQAIDYNNNQAVMTNKQNKNINKQSINKQNMSKQMVYKDIIKQKLCDNNKTERIGQTNSGYRNREEDRPLRIMHMKKMRDRYLNI